MQIQVIANCQARPVSMLVSRMASGVSLLEPIVVHLAKAEEEAVHLSKIEQADVIFAQLTQDQFQPTHLATKNLKERFGDKVIVWPNIFYIGQQPYLRYFTHSQHGRLLGPFEALHDLRLYRSWRTTGRIDPTVLNQSDPDFIATARTTSIRDLRGKEALCDVKISDFLAEHEDSERLFFTFNHPSNFVLTEMVRRLLGAAGRKTASMAPTEGSDSLSRYQVPSVWQQDGVEYQGDQFLLDTEGNPQRVPGKPQRYTLQALCEAYQHTYEAHEAYKSLEGIRLTPSFSFDKKFLRGE